MKEKARRIINELNDFGQDVSSALRTTALKLKKSMAEFEEKSNPFNDAGLEIFARFNAQTNEGEKEIEKLDAVVSQSIAGLEEMKNEMKIDQDQNQNQGGATVWSKNLYLQSIQRYVLTRSMFFDVCFALTLYSIFEILANDVFREKT